MIALGVAVFPIFLLLLLSEILWRSNILRGEDGRKMLHIIIGSYVASWAFFLTGREIELLSLALFVGVLLSDKFKIFHAIMDVKRKTHGDLLYAIGIGLTAFLAQTPWIFAVAILHMSIGDGLAGLIGTKHGKTNGYSVWKQEKSLAGSLAFAISSALILVLIVPHYLHLSLGTLLILLPLTATLVENAGVYGLDNIFVPLLITIVLNSII